MVQGNVSNAVRTLQNTLKRCYFYYHGPQPLLPASLDVDGNFGGKTHDALKFAQSKEGAKVDGIYGPESRDRLYHWWAVDRQSGCAKIIQPPTLWS
jgi:peptidoglycan hydrolase-like protein with peptidoglycan-binding domain